MSCIGNATCRHGGEAPTQNRAGTPCDNPAVADTLTEPTLVRSAGDGGREARHRARAHAGRLGVETVGDRVGLATYAGAQTLSSQYVGRAGGGDLAERNDPRNNKGLHELPGGWGGPRQSRLMHDNWCYRASIRCIRILRGRSFSCAQGSRTHPSPAQLVALYKVFILFRCAPRAVASSDASMPTWPLCKIDAR